jgi:DNA-binding response OmpR family regulator
LTVLLIDDDHTVREDLELFLAPAFELIWASGSHQAVVLLECGVLPDAVILDICLPPFLSDVKEKEGLELLCILRKELGAGVPVLVLSSLPRAEAETDCLERGAYAYLEKPCSVKDLTRVLKSLSEGRRS